MPDNEVHIVAGPSAAGCLPEGLTLSRDQVLIPHDLLSCGPLPTLESLEDWQAILAGEGNAVEWNGIDDWVAGVHLDSRTGRVRFHTEQTLVAAHA